MTPGHWAVCRGATRLETEFMKIERVTEKQIHGAGGRVCLKSRVLKTFPTYPEAQDLAQRVAGIRGEMIKRIRAAEKWAAEEMEKLI